MRQAVVTALEGGGEGAVVAHQPVPLGLSQFVFPVRQKVGRGGGAHVVFTGQQGHGQRVAVGGVGHFRGQLQMRLREVFGFGAVLEEQGGGGGQAQAAQRLIRFGEERFTAQSGGPLAAGEQEGRAALGHLGGQAVSRFGVFRFVG